MLAILVQLWVNWYLALVKFTTNNIVWDKVGLIHFY